MEEVEDIIPEEPQDFPEEVEVMAEPRTALPESIPEPPPLKREPAKKIAQGSRDLSVVWKRNVRALPALQPQV